MEFQVQATKHSPFDDTLARGKVVEESGSGTDLRVNGVHGVPVHKVHARRDHLHPEEPVGNIMMLISGKSKTPTSRHTEYHT